jgi:acetyl esterase/lipase
LIDEGAQLFGVETFYIGGESAGAHLSACTLLRLRDKHGLTPFKGANLHAGIYDLSLTPSARNFKEEKLILAKRDIEYFVRHYLVQGGYQGGDMRDPAISPLYADLKGMPKALFTVGTQDALLDDSLFMYGRWLAAGNEAELECYPGGCHVFTGFPGALSDAANKRIWDFLSQ